MWKKKLLLAVLCFLLAAGCVPQLSVTEVSAASTKNYTGWKTKKSGKKYYYKNGKKLTGFRKIKNNYYYFDSNGVMQTGWHRVKGGFRYFAKITGRMRKDRTVGGREIDSDGIWTPTVVLDPGHSSVVESGSEPLGPGSSQLKAKDTYGTQGVATGVPEYQLTLQVGLKLKKLLENRGYNVVMTRTDSSKPLSCIQRTQIANNADADAYIRIHANSINNSSSNGAMTICTTSSNPWAPAGLYAKSKALSEAVLNSFVESTGCRKERVWETDSMTGNNWSKVPVTIIEMGYMSNPSEDARMQTSSYQRLMVKGIANGLDAFFEG